MVLHTEGADEPRESSQSALRQLPGGILPRQAQQGRAQLRREHRWERAIISGFRTQGGDPGGLCVQPQPVEQHRFPHAPQAHHHHALVGTSYPDPFQRNTHGCAYLLAAYQFRRLCSRTRCVRVAYGIHSIQLIAKLGKLAKLIKFDKLPNFAIHRPRHSYSAPSKNSSSGVKRRLMRPRSAA